MTKRVTSEGKFFLLRCHGTRARVVSVAWARRPEIIRPVLAWNPGHTAKLNSLDQFHSSKNLFAGL